MNEELETQQFVPAVNPEGQMQSNMPVQPKEKVGINEKDEEMATETISFEEGNMEYEPTQRDLSTSPLKLRRRMINTTRR